MRTFDTNCGLARPAFTLIELMVVIVILAVIGGLLVPLLGGVSANAQDKAARATLRRVQEAILGAGDEPGYLGDMRSLPRPNVLVEPGRADHPQLRYLFVNPATLSTRPTFDPDAARGWRGPYVTSPAGEYVVDDSRGFTIAFGENGDPAVLDPWRNPLVIVVTEEPVGILTSRLVSAGEDGMLHSADDLSVDLKTEEMVP